MHSFWLALFVPAVLISVGFLPSTRRTEIWSILFWVLLGSTLTFFGFDLWLFLNAGNPSGQILERIAWRFLVSNGIPLVQATLAGGLGWMITRWIHRRNFESSGSRNETQNGNEPQDEVVPVQ